MTTALVAIAGFAILVAIGLVALTMLLVRVVESERIRFETTLEAREGAHRGEVRELLNRIQHPHLVPTERPAPVAPMVSDLREKQRRAWQNVGRAMPLVGGDDGDDMGTDVP